MALSINSIETGWCLSAIKFVCKASSTLFRCTHKSAFSLGGNGTRFSFISVRNASVPSEPARSLQKLNLGPFMVNGSQSSNKSIA